jgi:hypothetical protein
MGPKAVEKTRVVHWVRGLMSLRAGLDAIEKNPRYTVHIRLGRNYSQEAQIENGLGGR